MLSETLRAWRWRMRACVNFAASVHTGEGVYGQCREHGNRDERIAKSYGHNDGDTGTI